MEKLVTYLTRAVLFSIVLGGFYFFIKLVQELTAFQVAIFFGLIALIVVVENRNQYKR